MNGWRTATLGELVTEGPTNGYSGATASGATGSPTLRLSATTSGALVLDETTTKRLNETIPPNSPLWLRPGDLLVQRSNTLDLVGMAAIYDGPPGAFVYPDLMMRIRFRAEINPRFIWRYLNSPVGRTSMRRIASGSAGSMPKISGARLRTLPVSVPPFSEQKRIAEVLDKVDTLRAKRRAALAKLDRLTQAIFLDMFGDPATNPKRWPVQTLGSVATRITKGESPKWQGFDYQNDGALFVTSENVRLGEIDLCKPKYIPLEFNKKLSRSELRPDDLLVNLVGASIGRSCVFPGYERAANVNQAVGVVTVDGSRVQHTYVAHLLTSARGQRLLLGNIVEAARANISLTDLRDLPIPIPTRNAQIEFATRIGHVEKFRAASRSSLTALEAAFASLQHRAFRGEL